MHVSEVAKLPPLDRFLYWIIERHAIYTRRRAGKPKPWTDDEILQSYFFTNPYRENDKTTVWFRENVRNPLQHKPSVLMATVIFRWFNNIATGKILNGNGLLTDWNEGNAKACLENRRDSGETVFTGAYMIKAGNGPPGCKIGNVCQAITTVWKERNRLVNVCRTDCRLQALWEQLCGFKYLGRFMAYEIVCDLRYTDLLRNASDIRLWANAGPGALRGLQRMEGVQPAMKRGKMIPIVKVTDPVGKMHALLKVARNRLRSLPPLEMREIEHSLCEWDKYERALWQDGGKMKRRYNGCT